MQESLVHSVCSETPTSNGAYLKSNEGVIMVVPCQKNDMPRPPKYNVQLVKEYIKNFPVIGKLARFVWKVVKPE